MSSPSRATRTHPWREKLPGGDGLPPGRDRLISPYDLDARCSIKRDHGWGGYKVHFTETCDAPETHPGASPGTGPRRATGRTLVTGVATTEATAAGAAMTTPVHQQPAGRQLLPGEHLAGSGYPSAELIIHAARVFGITLVSPMLLDSSAQARAGAVMVTSHARIGGTFLRLRYTATIHPRTHSGITRAG